MAEKVLLIPCPVGPDGECNSCRFFEVLSGHKDIIQYCILGHQMIEPGPPKHGYDLPDTFVQPESCVKTCRGNDMFVSIETGPDTRCGDCQFNHGGQCDLFKHMTLRAKTGYYLRCMICLEAEEAYNRLMQESQNL